MLLPFSACGSAEVSLEPEIEVTVRCGDGPACSEDEICAILGAAGAQCWQLCETAADCASSDCLLVTKADPADNFGICGEEE